MNYSYIDKINNDNNDIKAFDDKTIGDAQFATYTGIHNITFNTYNPLGEIKFYTTGNYYEYKKDFTPDEEYWSEEMMINNGMKYKDELYVKKISYTILYDIIPYCDKYHKNVFKIILLNILSNYDDLKRYYNFYE